MADGMGETGRESNRTAYEIRANYKAWFSLKEQSLQLAEPFRNRSLRVCKSKAARSLRSRHDSALHS
jgi:hypothetical protein